MKVSVSWLRDYVDIDLSPEELARRLTLSGTKVERVEHVGAQWRDILVGRITRLEPHPDPDVNLQLATVSLGERGEQTVVTGAFNITVDDKLGLGEDHTGIRLLDPAAPEGWPLSEVLGDAILELEITTNRPDCLSVLGIAREVAAITGTTLRLPEVRIVEGDGSASELLSVRVEDPVLCPRFVARVITGVTIGPSPEWMVARLQAAGVRAINNVVDVTNYVMLEYGQPMHPYDAALLAAQAGGCNPPLLVIRHARQGETLQTLD